MHPTVNIDVLNRLAEKEDQDAATLDFTLHKPSVFVARANHFREAIALEQILRRAVREHAADELLKTIHEAEAISQRTITQILAVIGIAAVILVALTYL